MVNRRTRALSEDDTVSWLVADAKVGGLGLDFDDAPQMLGGAGLAEWERLGVVFSDQPTRFREGDRAVLIAYCATWGLYLDAVTMLGSEGLLVEGRAASDRGRSVKNPAVVAMTQLASQLRYLARELGLTPDSRAKLGLQDADREVESWTPFSA